MSDFNILRLNECNAKFRGQLAANKKWIFLWCAALLMLFMNLGAGATAASEGRWLTIAQNMISSGDFLHPEINGQAYYDKPLVSYLLIVVSSVFSGGLSAIQSNAPIRVTEFAARVPSALAALLALFCVISMTKRLFSEKAAYISAWVFVTMYSFVFWGRLAEADMENLAFIAAATAWYMRVREKPGLGGYALFWIICATGAQTKGLAAFVIPAMLAVIDMCVNRTLAKHFLSWKNYVGLAAGLVVYSIPFIMASASASGYGADGFVLAFRENIVRAVNPWDHKDEAWYMYFRHVAQLAAPWTPFLVLAVAGGIKDIFKHKASKQDMWLIISATAIFILFSLSQSRRVYYILPILPFCAMLIGVFLERISNKDWLGKTTLFLLKIIDFAIPLAAALLLISPGVFVPLYPKIVGSEAVAATPNWFFGVFYFLLPLCGIALGIFYFVARTKGLPRLYRIFAFAAASLFVAFGIVLPKISGDPAFRSEREFCFTTAMAAFTVYSVPPENVAFWMGDYSNLTFYLDMPKPAAMYSLEAVNDASRTFFDDTVTVGSLDDFRAALEKFKREGGAVITRRDRFDKLPEDLRTELEQAVAHVQRYTVHELSYAFPPSGGDTAKARKKAASFAKKKHILCIFPGDERPGRRSFDK